MTIRAVLIGLVAAGLLNAFCYLNDLVLRQSFLVGSFLPLPVYGGLLLVILALNPLAARLGPKWPLTGRELATVACLLLAACYPPGRGLMHYFLTLQMLPHQIERTNIAWSASEAVEMVPERMLADPTVDDGQSLDDFILGKGEGKGEMAFAEIPWAAWVRSLSFWLPLIAVFSLGMIALALVVHKQWSRHEHLSYPIATFATALLSGRTDDQPSILRNRLFIGGLLAVMLLHLNNYYVAWNHDWLAIPRSFDLRPLHTLAPLLNKGGTGLLFTPTVYFCVVGFAYFLPKETSLSLGLAPWVYALIGGVLVTQGVRVGGGMMAPRLDAFFYAGSYAAVFVGMLYTGRHYYLQALRGGLGLRTQEVPERAVVVALRVFLSCMGVFVAMLVWVGLDWQLALLYTAGLVIVFTVISRIVAETGAFFIHSNFFPCVIIMAVLGARNVGPGTAVIMMLVSSLLLVDPREALMPFVQHGLRIADDQRLRLGRVAGGSAVAVLLALAIAVPATLYWTYNMGTNNSGDGWANASVPSFAIGQALAMKQTLQSQGLLEQAEAVSGFARFLHPAPNGSAVMAFLAFFGLTAGCWWLRLRFHWWPLHPVLFCMLGTFQSRMLAASFLIGWLIKLCVNRYGGAKHYTLLKPLMIGLIAGEMLGGLIPMIISLIYYLTTGDRPPSFAVFRG